MRSDNDTNVLTALKIVLQFTGAILISAALGYIDQKLSDSRK